VYYTHPSPATVFQRKVARIFVLMVESQALGNWQPAFTGRQAERPDSLLLFVDRRIIEDLAGSHIS
jgi:hypothetical protein